jgi:5-methylcytosine-specific restriction endonuclease McrA
MDKLTRCKELAKDPAASWASVVEKSCDEFLRGSDPAIQISRAVLSRADAGDSRRSATSDAEVTAQHCHPNQRRAISQQVRRSIFARDRSCQFINLSTGEICGSRYFLEIDHIKPVYKGGTNDAANLRVLCSAHNKHRYRENLIG